MHLTEAVWFGMVGGLVSNVLQLIELAKTPRKSRPTDFFNDWLYWFQVLARPLLGGLTVLAYEHSKVSFNPILALHVGASAPLILQQFVSSAAPTGTVA
jgi:hypothetical protein